MKISNIKTAIQRKILNMVVGRAAFDSMSTVFPWFGGGAGSWSADVSVDRAEVHPRVCSYPIALSDYRIIA